MVDAREVMNVRQASQYLGVSADTLYAYVSTKQIPAFKLGNRWKFKKTTLDRWMVRQMARQSGGAGPSLARHSASPTPDEGRVLLTQPAAARDTCGPHESGFKEAHRDGFNQ